MSFIPTPPETTLDTNSPTAEPSIDQEIVQGTTSLSGDSMTRRAKPIYLIVATSLSPSLGIGLRGTLPWPQIKADMAFFRKATTGSTSSDLRNAVFMGRKTWESIPPKFRPLAGRINIVLTRGNDESILFEKASEIFKGLKYDQGGKIWTKVSTDGQQITVNMSQDGSENASVVLTNSLSTVLDLDQWNINCRDMFCIGGAEIYRMMLQDKSMRENIRILQTEVRKLDGSGFDCDTFFPESLATDAAGWTEASQKEVTEWVGVDLPQSDHEWARDEKAGVEIRVLGWKRTTA